MALNPMNIPRKGSGGKGGLWGKVVGGVIGGIAAAAAPVTGGASLAAIPAGMAAGGMLGGTVGDIVDPSKVSEGRGVPISQLANDPGVQLAALRETEQEMLQRPEFQGPSGDNILMNIRAAQEKARERMKQGRVV